MTYIESQDQTGLSMRMPYNATRTTMALSIGTAHKYLLIVRHALTQDGMWHSKGLPDQSQEDT